MNKQILSFPLLLFLVHLATGQVKTVRLDKTSIPRGIQYTGHIVDAVRWTDSLGGHIVVTTETGITTSKNALDEGYRDAALYAYHYAVKGDSLQLTWKVYDFTKECPVDIKANYIKNSFAVTDLNKDGKAEVWLMYKTVCHGDVSPSNMKIIMYEAGKKYAARGTNRVKYSEKEYTGGEYSFDEAFKAAPPAFREYAAALWKKHIMETWD